MNASFSLSRLATAAFGLAALFVSAPRDGGLAAQAPANPAAAPAAARPADGLISEALKKARAENKTVMIDFRASWCGPCGQFQKFLDAPDTSRVIQAHYVVLPLTIWETGKEETLNNPGAEQLHTKWGGKGIPFVVWLDRNGNKIADSQLGFPTSVSEVSTFSTLLQKTAPRMTPLELNSVATYLVGHGAGAGWAALSTRRLSTRFAGDIVPAMSRDGRYLADPDDIEADLVLRDVATGVERRLAHGAFEGKSTDEYPNDQPSFSWDGRQIAYTWTKGEPWPWAKGDEHSELRVIDVGSGGPASPRTLVSGDEYAWIRAQDWTPDGQWIAIEFGRRDRTTHLGFVSIRDGSLRVLKSFGPGALSDSNVLGSATAHAAFAPDGKSLAFDVRVGIKRDVFIIGTDGKGERPIAAHAADDALVGWSGDGKSLLFTSDRTGTPGLWTVPVDGSGPPFLMAPNVSGCDFLVPLSNGSVPYVLSFPFLFDVQSMEVDFNTGAILSRPAKVDSRFIGQEMNPRWSPDGRSLAFMARRAGSRVATLVIRASETGVVREVQTELRGVGLAAWTPDSRAVLTMGDGPNGLGIYRVEVESGTASWLGPQGLLRQLSSDGKRMYFNKRDADGTASVVERDVATRAEREVFRGPVGGEERLALSWDGRTIYYRQPVPVDRPPHDLIARDLATGAERTLVRQRKLSPLVLSPDGRFIVTASENVEKKRNVLLLLPTDGSEPRELSDLVTPPAAPGIALWAPDSRSVLVRFRSQNRAWDTWWVPIDGREARKLDLPADVANAMAWVVQPNGRGVAFFKPSPERTGNGALWIMELQSPASAVRATQATAGRGSVAPRK